MKIAIHGINGKMGLAIAEALAGHPDLALCGASVRSGNKCMTRAIRVERLRENYP